MTQSTGNWYFAIGQDRHGPVTFDALRAMVASGQVPAMSLVWTEGMANWVPAASVPELAGGVTQQQQSYAASLTPGLNYYAQPAVTYAGFWQRFLAWIIDFFVMMFMQCIIGAILGVIIVVTSGAGSLSQGTGGSVKLSTPVEIAIRVVSLVMSWLYFAIMESSGTQATLGKMSLSLRVTDLNGNRISFGRASGRFF